MENISLLEEDPLAPLDLNTNVTNFSNHTHIVHDQIVHGFRIIATCLFFLLWLAAIGADVFLMFIFRKFKNLRTRNNLYILHYAICNLLFHISMTAFILIEAPLQIDFDIYIHLYCFVSQVENVALIMCLLLIFTLGLDWFLVSFHSDLIKQFKSTYEYLLFILYGIGAIKLFINIVACFIEEGSIIQRWVLLIMCPIWFITIGILNYLKFRKSVNDHRMKNEYAFKISTIILCTYIPYYVLYIAFSSEGKGEFSSLIHIAINVCHFIVASNSILLTYLLGRFDKHFKMVYDTLFKKSVRPYETENLDEASDNDNRLDDQSNDIVTELDTRNNIPK